jgi:hypothetical protein
VKESWKYSNDEGDVDGWMRILSTKLVVSVDDIGLLKSDWRLAREVSSKLVRWDEWRPSISKSSTVP